MTETLFRPGWAALLSLNWMVRRPLKGPHVDDAHAVLVLNQFFCFGFLKGGEQALISVQPKPVVSLQTRMIRNSISSFTSTPTQESPPPSSPPAWLRKEQLGRTEIDVKKQPEAEPNLT